MLGVRFNGTLVTARKEIDFIEGTNVTFAIADDATNPNQTNVTINSTGGGASLAVQEGGVPVVAAADTLNFTNGFDIVDAGANDVTVNLDLAELDTTHNVISTTGIDLTLQQTGDTLGDSTLLLANRTGLNGARFTTTGPDLVDFSFDPSASATASIRYEGRGGGNQETTSDAEFQIGFVASLSDTPLIVGAGGRTVAKSTAAGTVPLTVKGFTGQSVDFFRVQEADGTVLFAVDSTGRLAFQDAGAGDTDLIFKNGTNQMATDARWQVGASSAGAPGLNNTGDPNTGIHWPGADTLEIALGGVSKVFIATDGQLTHKTTKVVLDTDHTAAADPHTGYLLESIGDAKGDIIAFTAADTPARLAVGADGTVLQADSAAGAGVSWQTPGAASHPAYASHAKFGVD